MIGNPKIFSFVYKCAASCETLEQIEVMFVWVKKLYKDKVMLTSPEYWVILSELNNRIDKYKEKEYGKRI